MTTNLRYALRAPLLKTPGFTLIAVLTLALCIGANSAIFSVVHAILLKPYPWPDSERLVYVYNSYPLMGLPNAGSSIPDYLDRKAGVSGIADAAMYNNRNYNLASDGEPERIIALRATPSLFTTLQAAAARGRVFNNARGRAGQRARRRAKPRPLEKPLRCQPQHCRHLHPPQHRELHRHRRHARDLLFPDAARAGLGAVRVHPEAEDRR